MGCCVVCTQVYMHINISFYSLCKLSIISFFYIRAQCVSFFFQINAKGSFSVSILS